MIKLLFLRNKLFFIGLFVSTITYGQNTNEVFKFTNGKTTTVLKQAEHAYGVYYSYADSLFLNKQLEFQENTITIQELHSILEVQNNVHVIQISTNLYSLVSIAEKSKILALNEVVVTGYLINTLVKDSKKTQLKSFNSELLPGVVDFDVLRALQQLPGVKSPNQTASGLFVKGGGPDQNLLLWNAIRIYHPGHLFGMISPVNPEMVDEVNFYTTTLPSNYGGRISSIIEMKTTDSITEQKALKIGMNLLYAELYHKVLTLDKKLSFKYSFRKSVTPFFNTPTYASYSKKVFQNTSFPENDKRNEFDFWDASFSLDWQIDSRNSMKFSNVYITNDLDYSNIINDSIVQNQKMKIKNIGSSIHYKSVLSSKTLLESTFHYSGFKFDYLRNLDDKQENDLFFKKNNLTETGLEFLFKYNRTTSTNFSLGYQISTTNVNHMISSTNANFGFNISEKTNSLLINAIHFQAQLSDSNYELNMGSRISTNNYMPFLFEPRINLTYKYNDHLQSILSYEKRSQVLQQINESIAGDISLENYIWMLTDDTTLPVLISDQINLGLLYKRNRFVFDFDIYLKKTEGITSFSEGIVFSEAGLSNTISTLSSGNSLINGFDFSMQKEISKWKFWTSYSFLNSENRITGINEGSYFQSNGNIVNSFNFTTSYKLSPFYLTLGWFWRSGRPYSELDDDNAILGINTKKLPDFHTLDFSVLYHIKLKSNNQFRMGIAINNLYNHHVVTNKEISRVYATIEDLATPRYNLRNYYSLGFTPNLFLKFSF